MVQRRRRFGVSQPLAKNQHRTVQPVERHPKSSASGRQCHGPGYCRFPGKTLHTHRPAQRCGPAWFYFFTNYGSRKGRELAQNPNAALTFFWPSLERQICVAGTVTRLPAKESESYFHSRPRGSQIAAWASHQSEPVPNRAFLESQWRELEKRFSSEVPMPPDWGGFILNPNRIEFWQGRPSRLHDRFCYSRAVDGQWQITRLSP